jgi:hypothetical protein
MEFCPDTYEVAKEQADEMFLAARIMNSPEFKAFVDAENRLVGVMAGMANGTEWGFHQAVSALGRCVNKSLTFKCLPWKDKTEKHL